MSNQIDNEYFLKKEITFSLFKGILYSLFASIFWIILNFSILYAIHKQNYIIQKAFEDSVFIIEYFVLIFFSGIIIQELIKTIILITKAKVKLQHLKFGFSTSSLTPYIECKYPVPIKAYKYTLIIPTIVILQTIWLSYFFNLYEFIVYSTFWLFFSMFDIITFIMVKNYKKPYLATSHTELPGIILYDNPFNEEL